VVANITTGLTGCVDEFAFDPETNTVVVTNNQDKPSFVTTISSTTRAIIGKIFVPGTSSIEQSAYNSILKKFFLSIPSYPRIPALAGGTICSLKLATLSIEETFPLLECNSVPGKALHASVHRL
jgi:hypothetical protein